ncbi:MAG: phage terminase small subunit P27 family, partial [Actinobacteria bacterium]|nr:phage terminase small subunit P27 family [Actinomycetota bacterium]
TSNMGRLGLTPADRTKLGYAEVKRQSKLEELQEKWSSRE